MMETTWSEVLVVTDQYAGDFESEMAAFLFGAVERVYAKERGEPFQEIRSPQHEQDMLWAHNDDNWRAPAALELSQAWEGHWVFAEVGDSNPKAVKFQFNRELTDEELQHIREYAQQFPAALQQIRQSQSNIPQIRDVEHYLIKQDRQLVS